eukprot:TRINITY_DN62851_c0_g1_i1.p3 TRINITY_DN62851_c0_g1~~TRINITY_DN62851_c0_g1_i1.p3  ORF type:complete len:104 (-),score=15.05 TRINITY_DN62851_c0_g1_i1:378-689(-)
MLRSLVGSEMCIRDSYYPVPLVSYSVFTLEDQLQRRHEVRNTVRIRRVFILLEVLVQQCLHARNAMPPTISPRQHIRPPHNDTNLRLVHPYLQTGGACSRLPK